MRTRVLIALVVPLCTTAASLKIENDRYLVEVQQPGGEPVIKVSRKDAPSSVRLLRPSVLVFVSEADPGYQAANYKPALSWVAGWKKSGGVERDLFRALQSTPVRANGVAAIGPGALRFDVPERDEYVVSLRISLEPGGAGPLIETALQARKAGWYSVAFDGIEGRAPDSASFHYQPLTWSWKRFPEASYLTPEAFATTAAAFVNTDGVTEGVAPDPAEIPYRFATFSNSRFGVLLRNSAGQAQPMVAAPVPGGEGSRLEAGKSLKFRVRYFQQAGDWYAGVNHLFRDVLNYRNERRNATVSLNRTLENMIDLAMNDTLSGWVPELKGCDYRFDVPGTVKVVSALHPMSVALLTGDPDIYRRRALPMTEFVLSREKFLYATDERETAQNPSHFLRGPAVEISELASLSQLTGGLSDGFRMEAERVFGKPRALNLATATGGGTWWDHLAMYRLTGETRYLDSARNGADRHIREEVEQFPSDFMTSAGLRDSKAGFYTDFGPRWMDLLELYEETREQRYLDASTAGARALLLWLRSNPAAPDRNIVVNQGGRVPGVFPGRRSKADTWEQFDTTSLVPEQVVPAWRTSLIGLPPEQGGTYIHGPVMLTHHAPWLLRLAHYSGDTLLRDAAYNGVLGRYANFPGYYFTSLATTVYQRPDYPLRPYLDIKYNAIFFNHLWPHISMLVDFLVSDAFYRSKGQVDFPSALAPGYAFLTSKVYGHRAGTVFGHRDVSLWLPRHGVETKTEINHLLGAGPEDLFVVLMNTAGHAVRTSVRLNPDVIPWDAGRQYRATILSALAKGAETTFREGAMEIEIPAQGLVAVRIHGLRAKPAPSQPGKGLMAKGYVRATTGIPTLGTVTAMTLSSASFGSNVFVYSDATEKEVKRVTIRYRYGKDWMTMTDTSYPYEFSIPSPAEVSTFEFRMSGDGQESGLFRLGGSK